VRAIGFGIDILPVEGFNPKKNHLIYHLQKDRKWGEF
jgi:hypothetical protein